MKTLLSSALIAGTVAIGSLGHADPVQALAIGCPPTLTSLVTNTTGCQIYSPIPTNPAQVSVADIQAQNFFGITDWTSTLQNGLTIPGTGQQGNWDISSLNLWSTYSDVMLVFKDGVKTAPVAYKLAQDAVSGTWSTPFLKPTFDLPGNSQSADVSNITVYWRGEATPPPPPTPIPTPAAVLPGLMGMGAAVFRKKKQGEQDPQEA